MARTTSIVLFCVCAASLLSSCGGGGNPRPDLLLVSTRDGDYAIYAMNSDGSRQKRLTKTEVDTTSPRGIFFQTDPAWSPDGSTIAFSSKRAGTFDLYSMKADGTETHRLTATKDDDTHPSFSPDGKRIAFQRGDDIFVMSADGKAAHSISQEFGSAADPAWSPDGHWIAYVRRLPGDTIREIWIRRPDGSGAHRLTSLHGTSINPAWSPDGKRIVFASDIVGSLYDLYLVGRSGGHVRRLTRSGPDTFEPAWSSDGSTIAFTQDGAIKSVDLQGKESALTSSSNNDSSPAWNPDQGSTGG